MVTPEQKSQFDLALKQAMDFILSKGVPESVLAKAKAVGPEKASVDAIMPLLKSIHQSAADAGVKVGTDVLMAVGMHVLNVIAELLIMAGVLKEGDAKQFATKVAQMAVSQQGGAK